MRLRPRISGAWRSGVAAAAFALIVVACSSGSDNSAGESPEETVPSATDEQNDTAASDGIEIRPEDSALVDVLTTDLGVEAGFVALVDALGRGYDITTIMSAVAEGTLQTNGQIIVSGELIAPTRPASVLLIVEDAGAAPTEPEGLRRGFGRRPAGPDEDFDGVNGRGLFTLLSDARTADPSSNDVDSGIQLTRLIVALARSGYSMDQIIQALVFDENVWDARSGCTAIADGLDLITPAYPDAGGCALTVAELAATQNDDIEGQTEEEQTESGQNAGLAEAKDPAADEVSSDIGPLEWTGEGVWSSEFVTQFGPATMTITRTPDTDDFSINAESSVTGDHVFTTDGFDEVPCTSVTTRTYEGTGTFRDEFPWFVLFVGVETVDQEWVDCAIAPAEPLDGTFDRELQVTITEAGIEGGYSYGLYTFPGVPIPIADAAP